MKFSKSFFARLFFFSIGGFASLWINPALFRLFSHGFGWRDSIAYAAGLAISNVVLFLWNYVVGFKSDRHWTDAAWRQVVCLSVANGLNYVLVLLLLKFFPHCPDSVANLASFSTLLRDKVVAFWKEGMIDAVIVFISFFKFGLYHYWVYPQRPAPEESLEAGQAS